jgi:polar amino acid transport system substrate-binding protein
MNCSKHANCPQLIARLKKNLIRWGGTAFGITTLLLWQTGCSGQRDVPALPPPTPRPAPAAQTITLHYNERPPYLITTADGVAGLTGSPATIAFQRANIPFNWKQTPSKRQMYILQQNLGQDCLVGWFKNPEREKYAQYTQPVYRDVPQIALARSDNIRIDSVNTVDAIFSNADLTMLVKDGYSYGEFLDQKIAEHNPVRVVTTVENSGMLKMVQAGRADYFFIAPEEAEGLIETSEFSKDDFKVVGLQDIPYGENRYILCSLQVDHTIINRLNTAIKHYIRDRSIP